MADLRKGSSPLARGLRWGAGVEVGECGIIPARAGFTGPGRLTPRLASDHPRSRGVYISHLAILGDSGGSSPLARGLLPVISRIIEGLGIIPARAGFTGAGGPGPV